MDKNLTRLLKWSIENQTKGDNDESRPATTLTPEAIASLFSGPSEPELMKAAMEAIQDPEVTLENKLIAFDNFEQLIESLDNANNITNLSLWTPLLDCLDHEHADLRHMAAWCVGTAVQNNVPTQERLLAMGGVPRLVALATRSDEEEAVRRKAIYAISSAVRNYQPAMDVCTDELEKQGYSGGKIDSQDMDAVDEVMNFLKAKVTKA
ncbi:hypothetical protein ACRALDRAFT_1066765 [Sodiomyces alcalophilus JCM 7366]|uniref:uncharacterized protein n=1 Tax=Sodiomyces alcalophilus JCM 7366 TaxID=591952 RepID=UPI0039B5344C